MMENDNKTICVKCPKCECEHEIEVKAFIDHDWEFSLLCDGCRNYFTATMKQIYVVGEVWSV